MPDIEFKPCPFCGRQPRFTERDCSSSERSPTGRIYFLACMCGGLSANAHQHGYSPDEVAEKWNRRSHVKCIHEMVKEFSESVLKEE